MNSKGCTNRFTTARFNRVRELVNVGMFGRQVTMRYFQRLAEDESCIREFCVFGVNGFDVDPGMQLIWEPIPGDFEGRRYWHKRTEGDLVIFRPPDGYDGGPVIFWYDHTGARTGVAHWVEGYTEPSTTEFLDLGAIR
jgi:hypothetical protein